MGLANLENSKAINVYYESALKSRYSYIIIQLIIPIYKS